MTSLSAFKELGMIVVVVVVIYNIYIIYTSVKSLSNFRSNFFKKKLRSDLHHKFEKHII